MVIKTQKSLQALLSADIEMCTTEHLVSVKLDEKPVSQTEVHLIDILELEIPTNQRQSFCGTHLKSILCLDIATLYIAIIPRPVLECPEISNQSYHHSPQEKNLSFSSC